MKEWIKITDSVGSRLIRVADINGVYTDEDGAVVLLNEEGVISVKESVDEILQLIEGEKAQDRLLERLKKVKEECGGLGYKTCHSCTSPGLCSAFCGDPRYWDIEKIEEALR